MLSLYWWCPSLKRHSVISWWLLCKECSEIFKFLSLPSVRYLKISFYASLKQVFTSRYRSLWHQRTDPQIRCDSSGTPAGGVLQRDRHHCQREVLDVGWRTRTPSLLWWIIYVSNEYTFIWSERKIINISPTFFRTINIDLQYIL